eukprot:1879539-Lingulodinium_polyedra.AAC.1
MCMRLSCGTLGALHAPLLPCGQLASGRHHAVARPLPRFERPQPIRMRPKPPPPSLPAGLAPLQPATGPAAANPGVRPPARPID